MTMKLYQHPMSTNSRKVRLTAHTLGAPLELVLVELDKGAHRTPEYLRLNPNGKVPTLVDGNYVLWESTAISIYLASKQDTPLWPNDRRRFDVLRWLAWSDSHWSRALEAVVFERLFAEGMAHRAPQSAVIERGLAEIARFAPVLNAALETNRWAAGDDLTIADFALVSTLMFAEPAQLPLAPYKYITRWFDQIRTLEAWAATEPR